jgi:hypothetical protein
MSERVQSKTGCRGLLRGVWMSDLGKIGPHRMTRVDLRGYLGGALVEDGISRYFGSNEQHALVSLRRLLPIVAPHRLNDLFL